MNINVIEQVIHMNWHLKSEQEVVFVMDIGTLEDWAIIDSRDGSLFLLTAFTGRHIWKVKKWFVCQTHLSYQKPSIENIRWKKRSLLSDGRLPT